MTTTLQYSTRVSQHRLFQFISRNIAVKPGHKLPKEFGEFLRIEVDKNNQKEINVLLIKNNQVRYLNRAPIPSKMSVNKQGIVEIEFHFTEVGFGAVKPLDTYKFTFKLCIHLSLAGKSAGFLFLIEQIEEHKLPEEIYLGRLFLQPNLIHLPRKNKKYQLVG